MGQEEFYGDEMDEEDGDGQQQEMIIDALDGDQFPENEVQDPHTDLGQNMGPDQNQYPS